MTSHLQPDVDGRDERTRAAADRQKDNDTLAKSYRYRDWQWSACCSALRWR
jgi:hypothetical protein